MPKDKYFSLYFLQDNFGIQGQGLITNRPQDGSLSVPSSDKSHSSRPSSSSGASSDAIEAFGSISMPQQAVDVLETVMNMNKALEQQIDTLRIRLNVESKNFESERHKIVQEKEKELTVKESEIETLKETLVTKDDKISALVKEGHHKDLQIQRKEKEISDLKELVKSAEDYAEQLQKRIIKIKSEQHNNDGDTAEDGQVTKLRQEIRAMKERVESMEKELSRAKQVIDTQSKKISGLETEKGVLSDRFKEELEKASRAMRSEVERMREVMKQQYAEMRNLREQNVEISTDVRDIKHILLGNAQVDPVVKPKSELDTSYFNSPRTVQKTPSFAVRQPQTSRPAHTVKPNSTVRTSLPTSLSKQTTGLLRDQTTLPPITKNEAYGKKWVPAGARQSTIQTKTFAKGGKK